MNPFISDPDVKVYVGDALSVLRELEPESVDCVVTSPPYWGLRDYGTDGQIGLEPTPREFVSSLVEVFREVRRVLAPHGSLWLNLGDCYAGSWSGTSMRPEGGEQRPGEPGFQELDERYPSRSGNVPPGLKPKDLVGIPWMVAKALQEPYYAGRIKDERERIWLAAMVEAEGCMFIHRRRAGTDSGSKFMRTDGTEVSYARKQDTFGSGLEVSSTDRVIVERCMAITGVGSISEQSPEQNARRKQTLYRWNVRSNECKWIVRELYPYFMAKQHEARLLLGCPSSGDDALKAWESLKILHQGGTPGIDFAAPESMFEGGWYLRSDIIWSKRPNPMPESIRDRPTKSHEYIFFLTKSPKYFFDQEAVREPHTSTRWGGPVITQPETTKYAKGTKEGFAGAASALSRPGREWNAYPEGGRNIRTVWEITTQPYPGAHFATFPEELPRRCILAGCPEKVCRTCGKPQERIVETDNKWTHDGQDVRGFPVEGRTGNPQSSASLHRNKGGVYSSARVVGLTDCGHDDYRRGVVLDPFLGSGTTAFVARNHGRHAIGIELSEEYVRKHISERLAQQSLLT